MYEQPAPKDYSDMDTATLLRWLAYVSGECDRLGEPYATGMGFRRARDGITETLEARGVPLD